MIYGKDNKFYFYSKVIEFTENAEPRIVYTDDVKQYEDMFLKFPRFANLVQADLVPSVQQQDRLEVLNALDSLNKEQWYSECNDFVQHGVIKSDSSADFLVAISNEYKEITDGFILGALSKEYDLALTNHLDKVAEERRYDNRINCALRAGFPGVFQAEGLAFAQWMDTCNAIAYQMLFDVQSGLQPIPESPEVFIASLPLIQWPV